ncbi:MAG: hypothetical protein ABT940_11525, partial [Alphaproteobacteria bacterium]
MPEQRNLILAVTLSMAILIAFPYLGGGKRPPPEMAQTQVQNAAGGTPVASSAAPSVAPNVSGSVPEGERTPSLPGPVAHGRDRSASLAST